MSKRAQEISRRNFLKGGAIAGLAVAATGVMGGCAPKSSSTSDSTATTAEETKTSWMTEPDKIADSQVTNNVSCNVVIVGSGYAGVTAFRELAEEGYKPYLVEKQAEDVYQATGNEFAALNPKVLQNLGVPHIDPVEFYQNWMKICGNWANQELVMKFAQNSEANSNWYLDQCTTDDIATMTTSFFPHTEHQMDELSGIKFWSSVCSFYGDCNETKLQKYNRDAAVKAGGTVGWGETAQYVIMEDDKVAGLMAKTADGYTKYTCKAVVLACGGFGGNTEMLEYFMPDMYHALVDGESLSSMSGNDGAGVRMAYWAGAHLETTPVPGMNFRGLSVPGKMNCLPQAVWIDENGKRFCNEYYPTSEQRGLSTVYKTRKTKFAVIDSNFPTYRQYTLPQHAGFTASEANITALQQSLDKAYQKFKGTYVETATDSSASASQGPVTTIDYIADDTLEGLGKQMGLTGTALTDFVAQIQRYNQYCYAGADQEFGRDAKVLFPVDTAPYYACTFDPVLGETMVTCGGILTDGNQNAVDKEYEPIPGLYVSGNDCGRRFGYEYITPIPGMSLGMALTLGRECGKSVGTFLKA